MNRFLIVALGAAVLWSSSALGQTQIQFTPSVGGLPTAAIAAIAAPFIGDAHPDVVYANGVAPFEVRIVDVYSTTPAATVVLPTVGSTRRLRALDFDGDGDLDLAALADAVNATRWLSIFLNGPAGFQRIDHALTVGFPFTPIDAADIDGDADIDLVIERSIFVNDGFGAFSPGPVITASSNSKRLQPGDFDGDGDIDFLAHYFGTINSVSGEVARVVRRNANGSYSGATPVLLFASTVSPVEGRFEIGDVDGDGVDDAVFDYGAETVQTWVGTATGVLSPRSAKAFGTPGSNAFAQLHRDNFLGDADGDGDLDLFLHSSAYAGFLANDGAGAFGPHAGTGLGSVPGQNIVGGPSTLVDVDLDGDGDMVACRGVAPFDLVTFENRSDAPVPAATFGPLSYRIVFQTSYPYTAYYTMTWTGNGFLSPTQGDRNFVLAPLVDPATLLPFAGAWVRGDFAPGTIVPPEALEWGMTALDGKAQIAAAPAGAEGTTNLTMTNLGGPTTSVLLTYDDGAFVTGGGQSLPTLTPSLQPIVFSFFTPNGQTPNGLTVTIQTISGPPVSFVEQPVPGPYNHILPNGTLTLHPIGAVTPGTSVIRASAVYLNLLHTVDVVVHTYQGNSFTLVSPPYIGAGAFEPFVEPVTVEVRDIGAVPIPGVAIGFSVAAITPVLGLPDPPSLSQSTVMTGVDGRATVTLTAGAQPGFYRVSAQYPGGATIHADAHVRRLWSDHYYGGAYLGVGFSIGSPFQPILLAVDAPMGGQGYVETNVGRFYTSILAPLPTLILLDGFGLFGPQDPRMILNNWGGLNIVYFPVPVPPLGIQLTAQAYGHETGLPYPASLILSNPITVIL